MKQIKKTLPEFFKSNVEAALNSLSTVEKDLKDVYDKLTSQAFSKEDLKKRLSEIQKKAAKSRKDLEKNLAQNIAKGYSLLNIPTRAEVEKISKQVEKIQRDLQSIVKKAKAPKKVAKPAKKKVVKKKVAKKVAKTAKKVSKKKPVKKARKAAPKKAKK